MINRGVNTWRPVALWSDIIGQNIARRIVFLARQDAHLIGTLTIDAQGEEFLWGLPAPQACYLAHFATRRAFAGMGFGAQMLGWAEAEARRSGKFVLRLDCAAANRALCAYYERVGFEHRRTVALGGFEIALYEKWISE